MIHLIALSVRLQQSVNRLRRPASSERGDVPGWVMVTLMTAGIVAVLWTLAGTRLEQLFNQAMDQVSGP
ncbi:MAG: hypothetical protein ACK5MP_00850 [Nostocoides sp.]